MANKKELKITRIFNASPELIWNYWTDPEHIKRWWGPEGFSAPHIKIDFRVGGKYLFAMHGPEGTEFDKDMWSTGTYEEIIPFEKIVVTDSFSDKDGNIVSPKEYGMKGFPGKLDVVVTFEKVDGKTKMVLNYPDLKDISEEHLKGMEQGWNQSLDKIDQNLVKID